MECRCVAEHADVVVPLAVLVVVPLVDISWEQTSSPAIDQRDLIRARANSLALI